MTHHAKPSITITGRLLSVGLLLGIAPVMADHNHHHDHHHDGGYYYGGGALFGGMMADRALAMANSELEYQIESIPPPTQHGDRPDHRTLIERQDHPYQQTAESRLAELDRLAASGAITQKQYQDRRLAIVDGL